MEVSVIATEEEQAVLSACLTSQDAYRFAAEIATPEDFHHPDGAELYRLLVTMGRDGDPVDAVTVSAGARRLGLRATPGTIAQLLMGTTNSGSVAHYAGLVREASVRRRMQAIMARGAQLAADGTVEPGKAVQDVLGEMKSLRDGVGDSKVRAKRLSDIMAIQDEFEWVIPGLLEVKDRVVVTAGEGGGKTTFIRQMAVATASGIHPIHHTQMQPKNVLVVDAENSERQWRRQVGGMVRVGRQEGSADPGENVMLACSKRLDITRDKDLGGIHRMIDDSGAELICIGPLYRLVNGSMNGEEDIAPVLAALDTIRDRGVAMIIEAHAGHGKTALGNRDLRPRGSSALLGWPEFGFGLAPTQEPGVVDVTRWRGDREGRDWPERLSRGGLWPWTDPMVMGLQRL